MTTSTEDRLMALMASVSGDPLQFVKVAFPWGEPGELEHHDGPDVWQTAVLNEIAEGLRTPDEVIQEAVASGNGVGKLHGYELVVPTPGGARRWGDLEPGDPVFGADGTATRILQCHHYKNVPMYRVTFDDGSHTEVSSGHLWTVRGRHERRNNLPSWRTLATADLISDIRYANGTASGARQWEIPRQGPARFDARETSLHPYLVGVWLGDGTVGLPAYTKEFTEIANKIRSFGYIVTDRANGRHKYLPGLSQYFKSGVFVLGSHERYIPDEYKYNSVAVRMALFEGLCDTDGEVHAHTGTIGYATTSRRLADDVLWLARSLGCKASLRPTTKKGWCPDENGARVVCRDCYRVTISAPFNPFTLEHRRARYKPSEPRYLTRWIDSIDPIDSVDGMCISVAADDGLYQVNDFIVTHNSSLVAWIILWALGTKSDTRGVVTANTEVQLRTKTWAELSKWFRLFIANHWFAMTATAIYSVDPKHERTWRIDAVAWSDKNPEAFAGMHNFGKRLLLIFDEASAIADIIWDTAGGALTDSNTEIIWGVFGNPTKNTGRFKDCFDRLSHRWHTHQIDQRTVKITNKVQIAKEIADRGGEDEDWVRIHIRGVFPRFGEQQFISAEMVRAAMDPARDVIATVFDPLIMGVDVARQGDDMSVIRFRRGRDARSIPPIKVRTPDTMQVAARVLAAFEAHRPDAVFIDVGGPGAGVVDRCRQLGLPVFEVAFGARASGYKTDDGISDTYYNKRAEMWSLMKAWLRRGMLDKDDKLLEDLTGPMYSYRALAGVDAVLLERKSEMKDRGLKSPDDGDALCITFAHPVQPRDHTAVIAGRGKQSGHASEYAPMQAAWSIQPQAAPPQGQGWFPGGTSPWNPR